MIKNTLGKWRKDMNKHSTKERVQLINMETWSVSHVIGI